MARRKKEPMIRCGGCKVDHPASAFSPGNRRGGDRCREVARAFNAERTARMAREYRDGLRPQAAKKRCRRCQSVQPARMFNRRVDALDGLSAYCVPCCAWYSREHKYGKPQAELEALLAGQGGKCAGCCVPITFDHPRTTVDHDHETGAIRGILCGHCNTALGQVRDNPETLLNLIEYLSNHQSATQSEASPDAPSSSVPVKFVYS